MTWSMTARGGARITATPSAGRTKSVAPSALPAVEASRAPGASTGASTSGTVFASTPTPSTRHASSQWTTSRERRCASSAATVSVTRADLDVAVPVLADEDDRDRVQCDPDEQRPPDGVPGHAGPRPG